MHQNLSTAKENKKATPDPIAGGGATPSCTHLQTDFGTMADDTALSVAAFVDGFVVEFVGGLRPAPLQKCPLQKQTVPLPLPPGSLTFLHPSQVTAQEGGH